MALIFPSATQTWHRDTYDLISPKREQLNCGGQTIIITGAGSGIGRETSLAYAAAGAKHIVLIGRTVSKLEDTRDLMPSSVQCSVCPADITDERGLVEIAGRIGTWDVLILNAGSVSSPNTVAQMDTEDWWHSFETNVKGSLNTIKAFLPTASRSRACVVGVTTAFTLPVTALEGISGYVASKTALVKMLEFLALENPDLFVASVHPGIIETDVYKKAGGGAGRDTLQLPAHFMVWLTSPEGAFLRGKCVWANWDVAELRQRAEEIEKGQELTVGVFGWDRYRP